MSGCGIQMGVTSGAGSKGPLRRWFNGLAASGYTGGPVAALDYQGVLRPGALNVPTIEGGRWATTVAEGAILGPELFTGVASVDGLWASNGDGTYTGNGTSTYSSISQTGIYTASTVGKLFRVVFTIIERTSGGVAARAGNTGDTKTTLGTHASELVYDGSNANRILISGSAQGYFVGKVRIDSVREVLPQWLPTATDGSLLYPAKTTRGQLDFLDADPLEFKRYLSMPARTNLFLNSTAPVTRNITTTAQRYAVSVIGAGSVELSGTATGTATAASPLVVTASAGTLTVTVTAPLTHVQVEAGAFATPPIPTAATTITRTATVCALPTAGVLRSNNLGGRCQVIPRAAGQTGWIWNTYSDANNGLGLLVAPTELTLRKRTGGTNTDCTISYTHAANTPLQVDWYQAATGMGIRYRAWTGAAWSAWSAWTEVMTDAGKADAMIASTYQIGTRNALECFAGNVQLAKPAWSSTPKTVVEAL